MTSKILSLIHVSVLYSDLMLYSGFIIPIEKCQLQRVNCILAGCGNVICCPNRHESLYSCRKEDTLGNSNNGCSSEEEASCRDHENMIKCEH